MAAPDTVTMLDLTGTYVMNKTYSDPTDEILRLQGIGWFLRQAIRIATVTLYVKHYKDDGGVEHVDIQQTATGGIKGNTELRILDWNARESDDSMFGPVVGKSRRAQRDEIEHEWQKEDWLPETFDHSAIQAYVESDTAKSGKSWSADQVWGFAEVNEERRYTRRVHFTGPEGEVIQARLVYDYVGTNTSSGPTGSVDQ